MRWLGVTALLLLVSCLDAGTTTCADGYICPAGRVCAPSPAQGCLFPDQLTVCADAEESASCTVEGQDGICRDGICALHKCGDGIVSGSEICDPLVPLSADLDECTEHSFYFGGAVGCTPECRYDYSECSGECGDGEINGNEFCEGGVVPVGYSCLDFGFDRGNVSCSGRCNAGFESCSDSGWRLDRASAAQSLSDVWMATNGEVFAGGAAGAFAHWDGTEWKTGALPGTPRVDAMWGSSHDNVLAGTTEGIFRWNGSSWQLDTAPATPTFASALWGTGASSIYAATSDAIHHYDGARWSPITVGDAPLGMYGIWGTPDGQLWVAGNGTLGHRAPSEMWSWTNPGGTEQKWHSVWGRSADEVYAGGTTGAIVRWNGVAWRHMRSPVKTPIRSIWGDQSAVYAATEGAVLYLDRFGTWSVMDIPTSSNIVGISGRSASDVIAVSSFGSVYRYDGSPAWSMVAEDLEGMNAVFASASHNVYLATYGNIGHYDGSELTWTVNAPSSARALVQTDDALFAIMPGGLAASTDGIGWIGVPYPSSGTGWWGGWAAPGTSLYIVGNPGMARRGFAGSWDVLPDPGASFADAWGTADTDITAVGFLGEIRHWNGSAWTAEASGVDVDLNAIDGAAGYRIAVGENGVALHNDGSGWQAEPTGTITTLTSVWVGSANDAVAVGDNATVLLWNGSRWEPLRIPTLGLVAAVTGPPGTLHLVTSAGELLRLIRPTNSACAAVESSCSDAWDDDCDGAIDCADSDCSAASHCAATESSCFDGLDNDGDGATDCQDADCEGLISETCDDGRDNDCDGFRDCDDDECDIAAVCLGDNLCQPVDTVTCGASRSATNAGGPSRINTSVCGVVPNTGPEAYFRFTTLNTRSVTVTMSDLSADLDLYVLGSNGVRCDTGVCLGGSATTIGDESVTFDAVANELYFFVADGYNGATSGFTLTVTCN